MARYQIILAYDGTAFSGSQRQAVTRLHDQRMRPRTVQGELEGSLRRLGWKGKSILMAGRTDSGTHARGQVAAFDLDWAHPTSELVNALNATLPPDLAVREAREVPNRFHPRYDATSRCYRYRLYCQNLRDPLRERYAWRVWPPVSDLTSLADLWLGRHDFSAFGTPPHAGGSGVREVTQSSWFQQDDEWTFEICANAYLYRMVRRLVYLQVAVGQGKLTIDTLRCILERPEEQTSGKGNRHIPSGLAPASGLTLVEVRYDNLV